MAQESKKTYALGLWFILWLLLLFILLKGHFAHEVVGDLGQPAWNFGAIEDIPGESPYAIYPWATAPQHVKGKNGE